MAKYYGNIGFAVTEVTEPGIHEPTITERPYRGDITRITRRNQGSDVNEDITISNEISIMADPYAYENFYAMRYAKFMGTAWKITNVEVQYPRLILTVGGVYNGEQAGTSE